MTPSPIIRASETSSQPRLIGKTVEESNIIDLSAHSSQCTVYLPEDFPAGVELHAAPTAQGPYLPIQNGQVPVTPGCACEIWAPHSVSYLKITADVEAPVAVPVTLKS